MKPQFKHELMTSFMLWFDNYLLKRGEAFSNKTGVFHYFDDSRLPSGFLSFASEFKQFVNDSSLTGIGLSTTPTILSNPGFDVQISDIDFTQSGNLMNDLNGNYTRTTLTGTEATGAGGTKIGNFFNYTGGHGASGTGCSITYNPLGNPYWRLGKDTVSGEGSDVISNVNQNIDTSFSSVSFGLSSTPVFNLNLSGAPGTGGIIDYENGRIIITGNDDQLGQYSTGQTLTGSFSVKDFNIYMTDETEEDLIVENKFFINNRYGTYGSGIKPYDAVVPAVFINSEFQKNEPHAFGGEDMTSTTVKAVVLAENSYQLDGILSIFTDSNYVSIKKVDFEDHPSTEYGGLKNTNPRETHIKSGINYYSYDKLVDGQTTIFNIQDVSTSKFSERAQNSLPGDLKVGFIDFDIQIARFPRA